MRGLRLFQWNWDKKKKLLEFIKRLTIDISEIENFFGKNELRLVNLEQLGDSHCKGRRTLVLSFQSTDDLVNKPYLLIYKPRPVEIDKNFQEFLKFINYFNKNFFLKSIEIIDKKYYGWIEFVEHLPIKKGMEKEFYYRVGFLLGVIYSLNGHDIHFENFIAHADQPILIDLECLFSIPVNDEQFSDKCWPNVHETAIIPALKENDHMHYDFSALLFHDNQISPNRKFELNWIDEYSVRIDQKYLKIKPSKNNPYYEDDSKINLVPLFYKSDITKGFSDYYEFLLQNKNEICTFIKEKFSSSIKRIIFRATFIYDKLMTESYHPRLLSNKLEYESFLNQIKKHSDTQLYKSIFSSEYKDILEGDIPCFFSYITQTGVLNSEGDMKYYSYPQSSQKCYVYC